jgi:hypothetical protein
VDDATLEEPLTGGNASTEVVRVGPTVRRPSGPWSPSIDALLQFFELHDVVGTPRALGYDSRGRQMLSYVAGYVDPDPSDLDVARLGEVGQLIRRLHDVAEAFDAVDGAVWNVLIPPDREDLICHHDLAPWNLVRDESRLTFIDWDGAGPGSRLWDLSYAAHGFVPLSPRSGLNDQVAAQRLVALIGGYGLDVAGRVELIAMLGQRVRAMYEFLQKSNEDAVQPWSRLWLEGHGEMWFDDALYVEGRRHLWEAALL